MLRRQARMMDQDHSATLEANGLVWRTPTTPFRLRETSSISKPSATLSRTNPTMKRTEHATSVSVEDALEWLERHGKRKNIDGLKRYGITATKPFGVTVGETKRYAKQIGKNHALAQQLWASGRYEARLLASFIDDPERVTVRQMNQWADDFDNWAIVDTVCFHLFDRVPASWKLVPQWAKAKPEFKKRAAFALLWSLSVHDKEALDESFRKSLPLIERGGRGRPQLCKEGRQHGATCDWQEECGAECGSHRDGAATCKIGQQCCAVGGKEMRSRSSPAPRLPDGSRRNIALCEGADEAKEA